MSFEAPTRLLLLSLERSIVQLPTRRLATLEACRLFTRLHTARRARPAQQVPPAALDLPALPGAPGRLVQRVAQAPRAALAQLVRQGAPARQVPLARPEA